MDYVTKDPVVWDPFHTSDEDPYPMLKRMREEAPLYYNEKYDFYALSRYDDCEAVLSDRDTFSSAKGGVVDIIKSNITIPSGMFIFDDPPRHTVQRALFGRMFTPKRMKALEPQIRQFCARALDPLVGGDKIDFVANLGAQMPMSVIGMLLGVPEGDQQEVRQRSDNRLRNEGREPKQHTPEGFAIEGFDEYLDWREKHPSDDLMSELITLEFEDELGVVRKLRRDELLVVINLMVTAGNETTNKLISWTGRCLADNPDQRRQIHADRSLVTQTIEEVLRFEAPSGHIARLSTKEVEFHGTKVPAGSIVAVIPPSANRDYRVFDNPDSFNIHRDRKPHLTFGYAWHVCLGNPLARLEGRIALEEVLNRFRDWEVDEENAQLINTSTVRGYEALPAFIRG